MKFNINKTLAGILVLSSFLPFVAAADNTKEKTSEDKIKIKSSENFCARLADINNKLAGEITKAEEKQTAFQLKRYTNIANKESENDSKRAMDRSLTDAKRVKNWDKMTNKAKTETQKTAIATYKTEVQSAINIRKASVDAAIKTYRDGLMATVNSNGTYTSEALNTFKTSITKYLEEAKTECTNNTNAKTANANLVKKINDARKVLNASRNNVETNNVVETLKKTRNNAIKTAETIFKTAIEKARNELNLALKK